MKKKIVLITYAVVFTIVLLGCNNLQHYNEIEICMAGEEMEFAEPIDINFQLLESHVIDTAGIRRWIGMCETLGEDATLTLFFQLPNVEMLQSDTPTDLNLHLLDLEIAIDSYEGKYFAITIGRELVKMQVNAPHLSSPVITFAEQYSPNVLYFYAMDPIMFWPSTLGRNTFYVMRGEERVYHGDDVRMLNYSLRIQEIDDFMEGVAEFKFLGNYAVDTNDIRERLDIFIKGNFVFFEQADTFEDFVQLAYVDYNLDLSNIAFNDADYQDKFIVITIGRELEEIRYRFLDIYPQAGGIARANVTFAEEYHEGILYIYAMDKIPLGNAILGGSEVFSFFVMRGQGKILEGDSISTLNCGNDELMGAFVARHFREVFDLMREELAE